jgi:SEL1 protein
MVSQNGLGFMHLNGYGVPQSNQVAADWFKLSAEQGFPAAQSNLGKLLYDTKLKKDLIIATDYFELAAKQGILEAQYYLAEIYNAEGLGRTCSHAVVYYKNVVERVEATQSPLGWALRSFENGDIESAIVGYMMAAEQGYEAAQANVAYLLDQDKSAFKPAEWLHLLPPSLRNSKLLPLALPTTSHTHSLSPHSTANQRDNKTAELALVYWTRSAKQNNMDSFVKMGDYYYRGIGLPNSQPDVEKAVQCYQVASQFQQSAQALWNLGYMYENGIGMKQDFHLAKRFYDQAMEANVEAYLPVTLSLLKLRVRSLWNTITGGDINPIGPDDSGKSPVAGTTRTPLVAFILTNRRRRSSLTPHPPRAIIQPASQPRLPSRPRRRRRPPPLRQ